MILKSTSRKDTNFRQIVGYLHKEQRGGEQALTYIHNINVDPDDLVGIVRAFEQNDTYRKKRKNGVVFYHDIMAFSPKDSVAVMNNPDMLRDFIDYYIQQRCPHALVLAKPHLEENHLHIHIVISGSERESSKSLRISKGDYEVVKRKMRAYQQEYYPELKYSYQSSREVKVINTMTHQTWQMTKQDRKQKKKDWLKNVLLEALQQCSTGQDFHKRLKGKNQLSIYKRGGKPAGIIMENKKYRFTTLFRDLRADQPELFQHTVNQLRTLSQEALSYQVIEQGRGASLKTILELPEISLENQLEAQRVLEESMRQRQEWGRGKGSEKEL